MSMIEFQFGYGELERKLKALNSIRLEAVTKKQAVQMYNRAGHIGPAGGGTPFDTGELMESRFTSLMNSATRKSMRRMLRRGTAPGTADSFKVNIICAKC